VKVRKDLWAEFESIPANFAVNKLPWTPETDRIVKELWRGRSQREFHRRFCLKFFLCARSTLKERAVKLGAYDD